MVTLEIEQIARASIEAAAAFAPVRPGASAVHIIQDRLRQKQWLSEHGFPLAPYREVEAPDTLADAVAALGPCIAKSLRGGYDGRGQVRLEKVADAADAWQALGEHRCVVEQRIDIAVELSVLVARRPTGDTVVYPPSRNHHTHGILTWSVIPAELPARVTETAEQLALAIATAIGVEGLLAVELFLTTDGAVLVNELAPRPHNSYHHSERACATSQFEQLVRAVCNLPLGAPTVLTPTAIVNLLGDVWLQDTAPDIPRLLDVPGSRLHLYGKTGSRPGRKMGHLSAVGATSEEAVARAIEGYSRLSPASADAAGVSAPVPTFTGAAV